MTQHQTTRSLRATLTGMSALSTERLNSLNERIHLVATILDKIEDQAAPRCQAEPISEPVVIESMTHSTGLVEKLFHPDPSVRVALAESTYLPADAISCLLTDPAAEVRYNLAGNHNISETALVALTKDEDPYVWLRAERTLKRKRTVENMVIEPIMLPVVTIDLNFPEYL